MSEVGDPQSVISKKPRASYDISGQMGRLRRLRDEALAITAGPGRPAALVADSKTLKKLESVAKLQCTPSEAAAVLGVSESTLVRFLAESESAAEAWERGRGLGKHRLRHKQQVVAMKGNPQLLMWLGRQYLGQTDKTEVAVSVSLEHLVLASIKAAPGMGASESESESESEAIEGEFTQLAGPAIDPESV